MARRIPEVMLCNDTIRNEDCYSQADQSTSIRRSYSVETSETDLKYVVRGQTDSIQSKRLEQDIEFRRLDRLRGVGEDNVTSMHESHRRIQHLELKIEYLSARRQSPRRNDDVLLDGLIILPRCQALTIGDFRRKSINIDYFQATEGVNVNGVYMDGALSHNRPSPFNPASIDRLWQNKDGDDNLDQDSSPFSQQHFDNPPNGLSRYTGIDSTAPPLRINSYLLSDDEPFSNCTINKSHKTQRTVSESHPSHVQVHTYFEDPKESVNKSEMVISTPMQVASKASPRRGELFVAQPEKLEDMMDRRKVQNIQLSQRTGAKGFLAPSGQLLEGATSSFLLSLGRIRRQGRDIQDSNTTKTQENTSEHIQKVGKTLLRGRGRMFLKNSLFTSPEEMLHRQNPGYVERAEWSLSRILQAVGFFAPAVK